MTRRRLLDLCQIVGACGLTVAGALLAPWVGFATGGGLLLAAGLFMDDRSAP